MEVGITLMAVWQLSCCCLSFVIVVGNLNSIHGSKSYSDLAYKTMKTVSQENSNFQFWCAVANCSNSGWIVVSEHKLGQAQEAPMVE